MPKRISDEQIEMIKSMSEKRLEQSVIAETVGVSIPTVRRYQNEFDVPASNRYGGGVISQGTHDEPVSFKKAEARNGGPREVQPREWCMIAEKVITLAGIDTGFIYTIGTKMDHIKITTNNSDDIVIELKDLVAFGNELLDIAEDVQQLKNNVWSL